MEQGREQFECSYCGQKFNFKKDAEDHEKTWTQRDKADPSAISLIEMRQALFQNRYNARLNVSSMQHEAART